MEDSPSIIFLAMIGEIFEKVQDFFGGGENFIDNLHGEGILIGHFLCEN